MSQIDRLGHDLTDLVIARDRFPGTDSDTALIAVSRVPGTNRDLFDAVFTAHDPIHAWGMPPASQR
ncbi:hypothetical protein ACFQ3B_14885 [Stackebrandtia endophytica]|uniref:hypothetical protein n=1 Tax=Stackebrandtia endophytica TaxID=1496996 RepID=UPI001152498C|nr:hypothetical protein [Stackebrandtia endophytica]